MFYKGNILEFSRKTEHTHTHTSWGGRRYFKQFVHVIMNSGKIEICKASKQLAIQVSYCCRIKLID